MFSLDDMLEFGFSNLQTSADLEREGFRKIETGCSEYLTFVKGNYKVVCDPATKAVREWYLLEEPKQEKTTAFDIIKDIYHFIRLVFSK